MSTIGGPGGIGGPKGPGGPGDVDGAGETGDVGDVADVDTAGATERVGPSELDALASDLAAGKLTPREAIDQLLAKAGVGLPQAQQAELRELITDLVANDPYLARLAGRV